MQYLLCKCRQKGQKEMASVMFTVPGKPQGKARARTYYNASTKKHCSTTPENTVLYENFIKDRYLQMAKRKACNAPDYCKVSSTKERIEETEA